jgi:DnaJ-class molecular chaperone
MAKGDIMGHGRPDFSHTYKQPEGLCERCDGRGYTRKTSPIIKQGKTVALGSGCTSCRGTGRTA